MSVIDPNAVRQEMPSINEDTTVIDLNLDHDTPLDLIIRYNGRLSRVVLVPLGGKLGILVDD